MINVAIVGLGWWGSTLASSLRASAHLRTVVGVDPDADNLSRAAREFGFDTTPSLDDALKRDDVEAVILCSPHSLHAAQIISSAEAGKHVFCEKPFTVNSAEARAALAAGRAAGIRIGIGHERRFEPAVVELQRRCREGGLGIPLVFEGNFSQDKFLDLPSDNWRLSKALAPVGPLSATGIHIVDLAISVLGRPVEVWARLATMATRFENGDSLSVTMGFDSGATATITATLTSPFLGRVCVMGSQGWMEIRDRSHPENSTGWDVLTSLRGGEVESRYFPPFPAVLKNLERFAGAVAGTDAYPISPTDIQLNVDAFEAITRSAASGRIEPV